MFLDLTGGIALTIFGVRFLRKGLDRLFGGRLVSWLSHMTQHRWKAFGAGAVAGTLAPSSTAISLITLQMLNAGQLTSERMLAVLLGANVGITVTVQFLAFRIQDYAGLFLLLGVIGFQFLNREVLRGIGQCLLSLGFIFFAMQLISSGAESMTANPETKDWMALFEGHPLFVLIFVTGFTVCVQSSTASIGFALALSASGILSETLMISWVLGANLGISLTGLAAGLSSLEGRRLAVANLLVKLIVALPILLIPAAAETLFSWMPGDTARKIAMFHTFFNVFVGVLAVPFLGPITHLVRLMIVPSESKQGLPAIESYLDPHALDSPSIALANATRETLQMADSVKRMLLFFWKGHTENDIQLTTRVQQEDDRVDHFYLEIKNYLSRIREGMTEDETRWQFSLLTFSNELESVGDIIDKNLCDTLRKRIVEGAQLSPEDAEALSGVYGKVLARFDEAVGMLTNHGSSQVKAFLAGKEALNEWCRKIQQEHYERLKTGDSAVMISSAYFLDMLNNLRRINSHITTIGYAFPDGVDEKRLERERGE